MNRKTSHLPVLKFAIFLSILSIFMPGTAQGEIKDEESRVLLERILDAHAKQSAALANYEFRAQWEENGSGADGASGKTSGTIHRVHQGEQCHFTFASTHDSRNTPKGDGHYEMESYGVLNKGYYATWGVDKSTGMNISLKWFELPPDGKFPATTFAFDYAVTRIRPLEEAMGHGGKTLQAQLDETRTNKIFTCREVKNARGEDRIRVTIDLPDHKIPGTWATILVNPAKGYLTEESVVTGPDGTQRTRKIELKEVCDGVWFPNKIVMDTTNHTPTSRIQSSRFNLLELNVDTSYPKEMFTMESLGVPPKLLENTGVARYYLDGRTEVTTMDGEDHRARTKRASWSTK